MTILEAIKKVLHQCPEGKTSPEITKEIIERDLYQFKAAIPNSVVNQQLRRHCEGLEFPSAHPVKYFCIVTGGSGKTKYRLLEYNKQTLESDYKTTVQTSQKDLLPEEKMLKSFQEHVSNVSSQLLDTILEQDPKFFEELVVKLLVRLGYGYGADAGIVVGKSHDGGIDGIIYEDKLGLDKIYIQAKRYASSNKVSSEELDSFIGAMSRRKASKGVFITTSSFTKPAVCAAKDSGLNLSLVDGTLLCELMVANEIGVRTLKTISIYEIDAGFFS